MVVMSDTSSRRGWLPALIGIGASYFLIGWIVGTLAGNAAGTRVRLAAWAISGIIFVAHIAYERTRLRNNSSTTALHAAGAAAVGGFLLAVAATINKSMHGGADARYLLALVIWPVIVAVPAFGAALIASAIIRPARD